MINNRSEWEQLETTGLRVVHVVILIINNPPNDTLGMCVSLGKVMRYLGVVAQLMT